MKLLDSKVVIQSFKNCVPPLIYSYHKGQAGRIGVVGGSKEYTGAPYFAGISALLSGADLSHIICTSGAASVIKSYSPELIVHPVLDRSVEECNHWISKLHSVVLGPGLGTTENLQNAMQIVSFCKQLDKPLVIDADGLYVILKSPEIIQNYKNSIITPNIVEFKRLYRKLFGDDVLTDDPSETAKLSKKLGGVTVVRKGAQDVVSDGQHTVICTSEGSPRRCGGQGDLLSGSAGLFAHWCLSQDSWKEEFSPTLAAGYAACHLTRHCARSAFHKFGRSTVTSNLIDEICHSFPLLFDS